MGLLGASLSGCYPDTVQLDPYEFAAGDADAPEASESASTPLPGADAGSERTGVDASRSSGDAAGGTSAKLPASPCDLSGRWIATDHEVSTGLGAEEAAHVWYYMTLSQTGSSGTVTQGFDCGENVRGISAVAADVDYPKTWPALMPNVNQNGRTFTSTPSGSGCTVSFEKFYEVLGATVSAYSDPSTTMPTASQEATSTTPGWEDWDNDGNPGITLNVTGLATGQIYTAIRRWTVWSGTIAASASTFQLADDWDTEEIVFGINGSSLLSDTADATRDNDASLHFVQFARLADTQATGNDAAICTAIRSLAPSMTPSAAN